MFRKLCSYKFESTLEIYSNIKNSENRFRNKFVIILRVFSWRELLLFSIFIRLDTCKYSLEFVLSCHKSNQALHLFCRF